MSSSRNENERREAPSSPSGRTRSRKAVKLKKLALKPSTQDLQLGPTLRNLHRFLHLLLILSPNSSSSLQHLLPLLLRDPTPRLDSSQTLERLERLLGGFGFGEGEVRELEELGERREGRLDEESVELHDGEGGGEPVVGERDVEDRGEERWEGEEEGGSFCGRRGGKKSAKGSKSTRRKRNSTDSPSFNAISSNSTLNR